MDPALKQRLLGAAVLLALLVIFVPMFFPGPAEDSQPERFDLDIPAEPAGTFDSRVFELDVPPRAGTEPAAPTAEPAPAPMPEPQAAPELEPVPAETPAPEAEATTPPATVAPATPASPGTAGAMRWVVSLGVFADAANADGLLAQAKLLGYPAWVEAVELGGKPARAVRVGPFDGRASAEAARLRISTDLKGAQPSLVAVRGDASADAPAAAIPGDAAGGFAVQIAAFRARADAQALEKQLRNAGFEAFIDDTRDAGGAWWRVRVGPRTQRADAEALQKSIKAKLGKDGLVVAHP